MCMIVYMGRCSICIQCLYSMILYDCIHNGNIRIPGLGPETDLGFGHRLSATRFGS